MYSAKIKQVIKKYVVGKNNCTMKANKYYIESIHSYPCNASFLIIIYKYCHGNQNIGKRSLSSEGVRRDETVLHLLHQRAGLKRYTLVKLGAF